MFNQIKVIAYHCGTLYNQSITKIIIIDKNNLI